VVQSLDEDGKARSVVRRFSDFEWLHDRLGEEFQDVLIPPIPEKQIINRLASSFVEYRRKELERFLVRVLTHSRLNTSQFVKPFLSASEQTMAAQRSVKFVKKPLAGEEEETKVGAFFGWAASAFNTATGSQEPTKEVDTSFDDLKNYATGLNERLIVLEAQVGAHIAKKRESDTTLVEFSMNSGALGTSEGQEDPILAIFWQKLSASLKKMAILNAELADKETLKFNDVLKDYVRLTAAGKVCLTNRFELLGRLQVAQNKNTKAIAALTTELKNYSESVQGELGAFKQSKTADFRDALRSVVEINMAHQQQVVNLWKELLSELEEHNEDSNRTTVVK